MATSVSRATCRSLLRASKRSFSHSARASSSSPSTSSSTWQPLLKPGVLPAYDEALSFLSSQSSALRSRIATVDKDHPDLTASDKAALKESLEIASLINDPSTLSAFQSSTPTHYDASNPAFRHLRERIWRRDSGVLAKLMERCTLMSVFPDVIPGITPTADVQISFGQGSGFTDHSSAGGDVLAGVFLEPSVTMQKPEINVNVFHEEAKKYTLVVVDPDQPDELQQSYKTSLLALKTDVELSATSDPRVDLGHAEAEWIPPHPQQGTKYHRIVTVLFEQPAGANVAVPEGDRHEFDLTSFAESAGLVPTGIHFWRSKWSQASAESVTAVYTDILKVDEPKYTKPPMEDKVRKQVGDGGSKLFS